MFKIALLLVAIVGNPYNLNPGEKLISITGVPVARQASSQVQRRAPVRATAQAIAQSRANWMARHNRMQHPPRSAGNFASVGTFEGVGAGRGGNIPTCTPRGRKMLVGDAQARGANGMIYRCRIWR